MFCIKLNVNRGILIVLFGLQVCLAQRRLKNGQPLAEEKRYMVYLIRALASPHAYDAWLCGGALVTARSIITAAACLEDVKYMYAIAGYKKYVTLEKLFHNECTRAAKKKVVITCVPKRYDFAYEKIERWSFIDIGIAKVESDFDFKQTIPKCSYAPAKVRVNFEEKWQIPGLDTFVLGWGHSEKWRDVDDANDYNQEVLHFTTTMIIKKEECKKEYANTPALHDIIDKYMICADGPGNIDPQGEVINEAARVSEGCDPSRRQRRPESCEDAYGHPIKPKKTYGENEGFAPQKSASGQPYGLPNPPGYGQPYRLNSYAYKSRRDAGGNGTEVNVHLYSTNEAFDRNATFWRNTRNDTYKTRRSRRHGICQSKFYGPDQMFSFSSWFEVVPLISHDHTAPVNSGNGHNLDGFYRFDDPVGSMNINVVYETETQNDHGGPLLTWVGSREYLIGVASVFRIDEKRECTGPYLYTSTQCNAAFIDCVLKEDADWGHKTETSAREGPNEATTNKTSPEDTAKKPEVRGYFHGYSRKDFCDLPAAERGFDMVRRHISWVNHPDGPADNELSQHDLENLEMRPQIPMSAFAGR